MIVTGSNDPRVTNAKNLDTTAFRILVECAEKEIKTLESLIASCGDADTAFSLVFNDGTTDFYLVNAEIIPATKSYIIDNLHLKLKRGQVLKAKASVAGKVSVVAITIDALPKKADSSSGGMPA